MDLKNYFIKPGESIQKQYEALRAFYVDRLSADQAALKFGYSTTYFKKLRFLFATQIKKGKNPFFTPKKKGPKKPSTDKQVIEQIIDLRKQNYSIIDIMAVLEAKGKKISLETIDNILKVEGFAPLPRRTRKERNSIMIPKKIEPPICQPLEITNEEFLSEKGGGILVFLPLIEQLGIIDAIKKANFPQTSIIDDVATVMSFLALKLLGRERLSHDETWNMDRVLGLFAGLNVLPKNATLSSYSYRIVRSNNKEFLAELCRIFKDKDIEQGEFNLDFKSIPHWGDSSVLEKNWSGSRSKSLKSILALIVQDPETRFLSYTDAEIKHQKQSDAVLEFVDFWKKGRGVCPKMLVFDSKFTTYRNLNQLNQSKEKINFLTLRRRGKKLIKSVDKIPDSEWIDVRIEGKRRKYKNIKVHEDYIKIKYYEGEVRQFIITNHGRKEPTFLISNDFDSDVKTLVKKYARRWLVEQEIAEHIMFFNLNQASSSIVVKVDFDLTLSLLAHNLYRILSRHLPGFENCTVPTIFRSFIDNGAKIKIDGHNISVALKKKTHLPILFAVPWLREKTHISHLGLNITFSSDTVS